MTDQHPTAEPFLRPRFNLEMLERAAEICAGCDLHHLGTQTVFGEGPASARVMIVGEQPGDREDLEGHPFVGPAGKLLDRGLADAGLDRHEVYVTNTVKHFRWESRGKRRIHRKPSMAHISACRPWLDAELAVVKPEVLVCLGPTAAQAILGRTFKVRQRRGTAPRSCPGGPTPTPPGRSIDEIEDRMRSRGITIPNPRWHERNERSVKMSATGEFAWGAEEEA